VRVIDENGNNLGILPINQAINLARQRSLDLVEIAPNASPPVCRIVEYSKFSYEQNKKARQARKKQHSGSLKEIQFRPNIGEHDFQIKINRIRDFLSQNHKVRVLVNLFGRALNHRELGQELMNKIINQLQDVARPEQAPIWMHRSFSIMFIPRPNPGQQK